MNLRTSPYERLGLIILLTGSLLSAALNSTDLGTIILLCVIGYAAWRDWGGVKTLHGLVIWKQRPKWQAVLFILFYPVLFYVYIVRVVIDNVHTLALWRWMRASWRHTSIGIAGILGLLLIVAVIATNGTTPVTASDSGTLAQQASLIKAPTATTVAPLIKATNAPSISVASTTVPPTATSVPPTATSVPPTATSVPPTATSVPPTATSVPPTATSVPPTAVPTPIVPAPIAPPPVTGVNGNPWRYNFDQGNLIYSPPSTICQYFACIGNFWNGRGYVIECADQTFSKSGGIRGSCSRHGGNWRPLLQP